MAVAVGGVIEYERHVAMRRAHQNRGSGVGRDEVYERSGAVLVQTELRRNDRRQSRDKSISPGSDTLPLVTEPTVCPPCWLQKFPAPPASTVKVYGPTGGPQAKATSSRRAAARCRQASAS